MIDVGRDDGAAGGDFVADELGRDLLRDALGEAAEDGRRVMSDDVDCRAELGAAGVLLVEVVADVVASPDRRLQFARSHVLADGDELHLGRDDALRGRTELGDGMAGLGAQRTAALRAEAGKFHEAILLRLAGELGVLAGEIAIVHRLHFAAVVFLDVAALAESSRAQRGQTFLDAAGERRIAPRPGAIIDAHRFVRLDGAVEGFGGREFDLAHRHAHVGVNLAGQIDAFGVGQLFAAVRFEGIFGRDHNQFSFK